MINDFIYDHQQHNLEEEVPEASGYLEFGAKEKRRASCWCSFKWLLLLFEEGGGGGEKKKFFSFGLQLLQHGSRKRQQDLIEASSSKKSQESPLPINLTAAWMLPSSLSLSLSLVREDV